MGFNENYGIDETLGKDAYAVPPETADKCKRVIAGAQATRDSEDASTIMQALGLVPYREAPSG